MKGSGGHRQVYVGVLLKKITLSLTFIQCLLTFFLKFLNHTNYI